MNFYRVFDWNPTAALSEYGGPFYVPREQQKQGRHDIPELEGVLYASLSPLGAIAEVLQVFAGSAKPLSNIDFQRPSGLFPALVCFHLDEKLILTDMDDPAELASRRIRPSQMATFHREITHAISIRLYQEGLPGFLWWSTLEASWINATLFESRVRDKVQVQAEIQKLNTQLPELRQAADWLNLDIEK